MGFAAVVAVSDTPAVASGTAGVEWSSVRARELVEGIAGLEEELGRRGGHVPLLRLPFALERAPEVPEGYDTVVRLPLRDEAVEPVRRQLGQVGAALMLALPALEHVEIDVDGDVRTLTAERRAPGEVVIDGGLWRTVEEHGELPAELLRDRPVEERARPFWQVRWALPEEGLPEGTPGVLHAPTPSDERLDLPALLIASFPLAPDRRHVAPGALTDFLIDRAAEAYVRLLGELPVSPRVLDLVPGPIAAGELDARIRRVVRERLPEAPVLPHRTRGRDAIAVDAPAAFVEVLGGGDTGGDAVVGGLLPPEWPARSPALAALGVRRVELADVIDELAAVDREPAWWHRVYEALTGAATDALGALPVPLAGGTGRVVRGPRGLLIADGVDPAGLDVLGLRFVHPEAVHPLLARLGAVEAARGPCWPTRPCGRPSRSPSTPTTPTRSPRPCWDWSRPRTPIPATSRGWPSSRCPATTASSTRRASCCCRTVRCVGSWPTTPLFGVVDGEVLERWGAETLAAAGVLDGFALAKAEDVNLTGLADEAESLDLDDEDLWADEVLRRIGEQDLPRSSPSSRRSATSNSSTTGRRRSGSSPHRRGGPRSWTPPMSPCTPGGVSPSRPTRRGG
ncbi:hypothetical protein ACFQY7_47145 [Actinomadura luteofluorescens]|uniref:hypothetical protein n=1 Tax=Actinomadura luteofluorescens TaxID=46163 RepID=UPI00363A285D